ncbi:hypothetical protein DCC85_22620 [Paenibacillus sp. CAA11]|uniref:hypothetical protein n=1 Tax=Paenibacillus sp. CAA11 TaxID=1532905 RepID=UPI000D39546B|nr:hypothetical protein [Paenibacillus sp. CAA11]AWB46689.1 hypothetical protein DCC85_22620 [Paenibacillus sp. CAA11]
MRKKYSNLTPEERWQYMQQRGKLDFLFIRPLLMGLFIDVVLFGLFFVIGSIGSGLVASAELLGELISRPGNVTWFIFMLLVMPAVYIATNALIWILYRRKYGRASSENS